MVKAVKGQKKWFVFATEMGRRGGRWEGGEKQWEVSNSNIVQKGEREQMAVENADSKLWRKRLYWQILLFPIQAWTLWHGELRRYKERPLFPATCYGQLASDAFWEKTRHRQTNRYGNKPSSQLWEGSDRMARNSCLFLALELSIRKSISSLSHLPFQSKLLQEVSLKLLVFALSWGEKKDRSELVLLIESRFL